MSKEEKTHSGEPQAEEVVTVDMMPFLMPLAIVLSAVILSVSMYMSAVKLSGGSFSLGGSDKGAVANDAAPAAADDGNPAVPQKAKTSIDDDAVMGDKNKAKIAIVEFSDYQCPFCQRFHSQTLGQIKSEFVDKGQAVFVYRDLPLVSIHPNAQKYAEATECAGEQGGDKFFAMHDKIFQATDVVDDAGLKKFASDLGLNTGNFNSCLDEGKMKAEVDADSAEASKIGINGTPGFVVGKLNKDGSVEGEVISGAQPFSAFQAAVEKYK